MSAKISQLVMAIAAYAVTPASGQEVSLYAEPDEATAPIAHADLQDGSIERQTPVADARKQAAGWQWAQYTGEFRGFVRSGDYPEGGLAAGTLVFSAPSETAAVITSIAADDRATAASPADAHGFREITLSKRIGVYLNRDHQGLGLPETSGNANPPREQVRAVAAQVDSGDTTRPSTSPAGESATQRYVTALPTAPPAVDEAADEVTAPETPEPQSLAASTDSAAADNPDTEPDAGAPGLATSAETAASEPPAPSAAPEPPVPPAPPAALSVPPALDNSITLRGELVEARSLIPFRRPPAAHLLRDIDGNRIAWVNLSDALLSQPLPQLLDARVNVYGEWRSRENGREMVLEVRTIRPSF